MSSANPQLQRDTSHPHGHPAFQRTDHRPWSLPAHSWSWRQTWLDLLFAHWPIEHDAIRGLVPPELEIDEYDGRTWIGVIPFHMRGVMPRRWPDLPGISAFPELNVRLYVRHQGKAGVWFLSLDAARRLAVWTARRFFHLPYFHARMSWGRDGDWLAYRSARSGADGPRFEARYRPTSAVVEAEPGSLEHWLTERYCLFARSPKGQLFRCEVHHVPWPLQLAEAEIERNEMLRPHGLHVSGAPLLHYARGVDVAVWTPEAVT